MANQENLYICYYASVEELDFLRKLLRYETMVRLTLALKAEIDEQTLIYGFMSDFDFYRQHDDVLDELIKALERNQVNSETVVVLQKYAVLHEFLLTITIEGGIPEGLNDKAQKLGPDLLEKIKKGLANPYTVDQLSGMRASPVAKSEKDDLGINIFGVGAIA